MPTNKAIIISVIAYVVLFASGVIYYMTMKVTGDAAGKGLEKGYAFIFGTGVLLLIGVTLTIVCLFFFSKVTVGWIKFVAFVPVILPLLVIASEFIDLNKKLPPEDVQRHIVVIDVRSVNRLDNFKIKFRSGRVSSVDNLEFLGDSEGHYYYQKTGSVYYQHHPMFTLYRDNMSIGEVSLDIPEEPAVAPYTEWQAYPVEKAELQDSVQIEFRFKVTK